jgi:hypothetical protein
LHRVPYVPAAHERATARKSPIRRQQRASASGATPPQQLCQASAELIGRTVIMRDIVNGLMYILSTGG